MKIGQKDVGMEDYMPLSTGKAEEHVWFLENDHKSFQCL